jgi:hypothetical protein
MSRNSETTYRRPGKPLRRLTIFGQPKVEITRIA